MSRSSLTLVEGDHLGWGSRGGEVRVFEVFLVRFLIVAGVRKNFMGIVFPLGLELSVYSRDS